MSKILIRGVEYSKNDYMFYDYLSDSDKFCIINMDDFTMFEVDTPFLWRMHRAGINFYGLEFADAVTQRGKDLYINAVSGKVMNTSWSHPGESLPELFDTEDANMIATSRYQRVMRDSIIDVPDFYMSIDILNHLLSLVRVWYNGYFYEFTTKISPMVVYIQSGRLYLRDMMIKTRKNYCVFDRDGKLTLHTDNGGVVGDEHLNGKALKRGQLKRALLLT